MKIKVKVDNFSILNRVLIGKFQLIPSNHNSDSALAFRIDFKSSFLTSGFHFVI